MSATQEQDDKLRQIVKEFIQTHQITCAETIYQCDWVIEKAYYFIERLCDEVGYYTDETGS